MASGAVRREGLYSSSWHVHGQLTYVSIRDSEAMIDFLTLFTRGELGNRDSAKTHERAPGNVLLSLGPLTRRTANIMVWQSLKTKDANLGPTCPRIYLPSGRTTPPPGALKGSQVRRHRASR